MIAHEGTEVGRGEKHLKLFFFFNFNLDLGIQSPKASFPPPTPPTQLTAEVLQSLKYYREGHSTPLTQYVFGSNGDN